MKIRSLFLRGLLIPMICFAAQSVGLAQTHLYLTLENHRFDKERLEVKAGEVFLLTIVNKDKTLEEFESKSLIIEKFLKPGATLTVTLGPLKPGEYDYFADFHKSTGKGVLVAKP
jgi:plastocyanin